MANPSVPLLLILALVLSLFQSTLARSPVRSGTNYRSDAANSSVALISPSAVTDDLPAATPSTATASILPPCRTNDYQFGPFGDTNLEPPNFNDSSVFKAPNQNEFPQNVGGFWGNYPSGLGDSDPLNELQTVYAAKGAYQVTATHGNVTKSYTFDSMSLASYDYISEIYITYNSKVIHSIHLYSYCGSAQDVVLGDDENGLYSYTMSKPGYVFNYWFGYNSTNYINNLGACFTELTPVCPSDMKKAPRRAPTVYVNDTAVSLDESELRQ